MTTYVLGDVAGSSAKQTSVLPKHLAFSVDALQHIAKFSWLRFWPWKPLLQNQAHFLGQQRHYRTIPIQHVFSAHCLIPEILDSFQSLHGCAENRFRLRDAFNVA